LAEALLLDTFSLFFRAFFALPPMNTRAGEPTSALYGFSALLLKLMREHPSAELCFAVDAPRATFRHIAFSDYKAQRESAPTPLLEQMGRLRELLAALEVPVIQAPGFEADDVLASVTAPRRHAGLRTLIVSGDRDLLQLAHGSVEVYFVGRRGKEAIVYDAARVEQRFGVPPECLPAYMALVGDVSDNLPGVPGIGPSTAAKLLHGRTGCEELLSDLASVKPARIAGLLSAHAQQIRLNERLSRLREDAPLPEPPLTASVTPAALSRLRELFGELEFESLLARLDKLSAAPAA
jgi:DNA polymerase-1